jgi:hypothetical protein
MPESEKETVIIVHGTWAGFDPDAVRWWQPMGSYPAPQAFVNKTASPTSDDSHQPAGAHSTHAGFVAKLDAALEERGSPARCWANCTEDKEVFHWSGDNSWIARTQAASKLAEYLAELRKEGWRCHIVAHSHGGNIVVEALPQVLSAPKLNAPLGNIVTLGAPFVDTISPMLKRADRQSMFVYALFQTIFISVSAVVIFMKEEFGEVAFQWAILLLVFVVGSVFFKAFLRFRSPKDSISRDDIFLKAYDFYLDHYHFQLPKFLALGSSKDEAWQILHHMRTISNPLAVTENPLSYLLSWMHSAFLQRKEVARRLGARSYYDLTKDAKRALVTMLLLDVLYGVSALWMYQFKFYVILAVATATIVFLYFLRWVHGEAILSVVLGPFRWFYQRAWSLAAILPTIVTYGVRYLSWSVILKTVMGLEGYPLRVLPLIDLFPHNVDAAVRNLIIRSELRFKSWRPEQFIKYESISKDAEQLALDKRGAWISQHLGHVSDTFSSLIVSVAEIKTLLKLIEKDQTLVHAAYYTDDECIARIANWIAGTEDDRTRP